MQPAADEAPHATRQKHGDDHGQQSKQDQVPGAQLRQALLDGEEDGRPNDRSLDTSQTSDQRDEDHLCRPRHAEDGARQHVELADDDERAARTTTGCRNHVDDALRRRHPHADAASRQFVVPDRRQIEPHPAAQQEVSRQQRRRRDGEGTPVGKGAPERGIDQGQSRQGGSRASPQRANPDQHEIEDFGDHPGADRKVLGAQPKDEERDRDGKQPSHRDGGRNRHERIDAVLGEHQHGVGADPDVGLLPDRNQSAVSGQKIPHAGQHQQDEDIDQQVRNIPVHHIGKRRQHDDDRAGCQQSPPCWPPRASDLHAASLARIKPCGRKARTARNTRCPARTPPLGSICAPIA